MSPIPGIDDYDDDEDVSPPPAYRKKRGLDQEQGCGREKRICATRDVDEEDEELYGNSSGDTTIQTQVKFMTLTTEKLPGTETEFLHRLLSVDSFPSEEVARLERLFDVVKKLEQMDVTSVFQVAFGTCLSLEAAYRQNSLDPNRAEYQRFYPYFKTKSDGLMHISCFCFATPDQAIRAKFGHLVSVEIIPIDASFNPCCSFAYVAESRRRLPDKSLRLEANLMSHLHFIREQTVVHELALQLPFCEQLFRYSNFHINVAPVCSVGHLLMQWRAVYGIATNPLFRYIVTKDFSLSPTGILITADDKFYSPQQLESIQRAVDVVMHPVLEHGNPCKAVYIDGDATLVRPTICQILTELLTATRLQFIVSSSGPSLRLLVKKLKQEKLIESKAIFLAGNDDVKHREYAKTYAKMEIEKLQTSLDSETDAETKKQIQVNIRHLTQCLNAMSKDGIGTNPVTAEVQDTIDDFTHRALQYSLRSARLIFGTLKDFSQSQDVYEHLRSPKVHASIGQTSLEEKKRYPMSTCMIAEAESMTDPQLMAFAKEFDITRFVLSSSWFSSDEISVRESDKRPIVQVEHSFSHRLKQTASNASNSLVVEIPAIK